MAKLREEAEAKPDDLEIISIGALYKGPWDKKYWSCSRGKDRYPYPVGYQAVRAQDGNTCKMEIHEGSKGPVFAITNADGLSYSGETPAIAWGKFQKKCFPHMKIWHGKRFSCKIDGIEFFGFKNAFVQRLLRELVANLDGGARRSLLSSTFCNGASVPEQERGCMSTCADPELLACIPKPPTAGKRRQRCGTVKTLGTGGSLKRLERQMQSSEAISHSRQKRQKTFRNTLFSEENNVMTSSHDLMLSSKADEDGPAASFHNKDQMKDSDGLSNGIGRADIAGGSNDLPGNCVSTEIVDTSTCHLILSCKEDEDGPAANIHKKVQIIGSVELSNDIGRADIVEGSNAYPGNSVSAETSGSACKLEKPLDRLRTSEMHQMNSSTSKEDNEEGVFVADSLVPNDEVLCVDDTLDELQDNPCGHDTVSHKACHSKLEDDSGAEHAVTPEATMKDTHCNLEDKSAAAQMVKTKPMANESCPEEETGPEDNSCDFAPTATMKDTHCNLDDKSAAAQVVKTKPMVNESCPEEETGPEDNSCDFAPTATMKDTHCNLDDKSAAAQMVKTKPMVSDSCPEEETGPYISAGSSEKSDFDSVNQEIDKTMMSVWLPQAVPLLKKYSRKRKQIKTRDAILSGHTQIKQEVFPIQARNADVAVRILENAESSSALENLKVDESGDQAYYQDIPDSMDMIAAATMLNHEKLQSISDKKPLEDESHLRAHVLTQEPDGSHFAENVSLHINMISSKKHSEDLKVSKEFSADENEVTTSSKNTGETFRDGYQHGDCIPTTGLEKDYEVPLSESIICRNSINDYLPDSDSYLSNPNLLAPNIHKPSSMDKTNHPNHDTGEPVLDGDPNVLKIPTATLEAEHELKVLPVVLENRTSISTNNTSNSFAPSVSQVKEAQSLELMTIDENKHTAQSEDSIPSPGPAAGFSDELFILAEDQARLHPQITGNVKLHNELEEILQLVGCYSHSIPIMSVLLRRKGNELYVCVQCGLLEGEIQTLFLYNLLLEEPRKGCPSFIGHTSVLPPITDHAYGIKRHESWYQVTPDGRSVVLLGNVKIPFCREGRISCSCSICAPVLFDGSTIRIVQLNLGYVTVVLELKASDSLLSVLVCDPNYLVAVGENGGLHVWIMNLPWSGQVDDFDLSTSDGISPCIVEVKKIPKCAALVVGYNAFGEFSLWDISKRILVSKFSSLSTSLHHFLPISSLSCSWKDLSSSTKLDDHINSILASTKKSFQKNSDDGHCFVQLEGKGIAVWILASAVSDFENDFQSNALALGGLWRLALLAKNSVILGSPLDTRASSIGALSGNGILGTSDGLVYMWDLSNGTKLGNLHQFKGGSVSCIATDDDSTSGFLAVAGEDGDLMIYQSRQILEADSRT